MINFKYQNNLASYFKNFSISMNHLRIPLHWWGEQNPYSENIPAQISAAILWNKPEISASRGNCRNSQGTNYCAEKTRNKIAPLCLFEAIFIHISAQNHPHKGTHKIFPSINITWQKKDIGNILEATTFKTVNCCKNVLVFMLSWMIKARFYLFNSLVVM